MPQRLTRRSALHALAAAGTAAALPRLLAQSVFPPQAEIDDDPLRPRFHLMPRRGWMNDPCAPLFFRGRYHLFFQYNPGASIWGDMHWAHVVSDDMIHWRPRPIALAPTPTGPDAFGVFTGTAITANGVPDILYTCVSPSSLANSTLSGSNPPEREAQCLATPIDPLTRSPDAALDDWHKLPQPVIAAPPPGMHVSGFRDPVPWQEPDGSFYLLLASGETTGGNVLLYKSADLHTWHFEHIFAQGKATGADTADTVDSGRMWECPDFFPLGDKHVLIHSTGTLTGRKTFWQTGTLDRATMRWSPEHEGILNHGPYYAPKTQLDAAGNRILWGWIEETRPQADFAKAGWAGCMSLPRVLTLDRGELRFTPAPEIASLRSPLSATGYALAQHPPQLELHLEARRGQGTATGLPVSLPWLHISNTATEQLRWNDSEIPLSTPFPDAFTIRCLVDHSVLELFLGDRVVLTARVYDATKPAHLELPAGYRLNQTAAYTMAGI